MSTRKVTIKCPGLISILSPFKDIFTINKANRSEYVQNSMTKVLNAIFINNNKQGKKKL